MDFIQKVFANRDYPNGQPVNTSFCQTKESQISLLQSYIHYKYIVPLSRHALCNLEIVLGNLNGS